MVSLLSRRRVAVLALSGFALLAAATTRLPTVKLLKDREPEVAPGELVVKLKARSGARLNVARSRLLQALESRLGAHAVSDIQPLVTDPQLQVVKLSRATDLVSAMAGLQLSSDVEYVEPNYIYRASVLAPDAAQLRRSLAGSGIPNDPDFSKTWGLQNVGQLDTNGQVGTPGSDIRIVPLWQDGFKGSRNVLVAVIDTGIDWTHPDLVDNLFTNRGESGALENDGKDNDENGFIDDVHGWNFATGSANSADDHNHGTHCAGTIGGVGNNGRGVAGVNWEVSLMPVKFLDQNGGGKLSAAVDAINYARLMKAQVLSNSWGGGGYSRALEEAIHATRFAGQIFVAAAGNESNDNDANPTYPASYDVPNIISVAASDNQDKLAKFSNYGSRAVHVAAPGVKVYSTVKGGTYATFSGTSMATPHVAGIAALMLAAHPEWTPAEIKQRLISTSDPVNGLRRRVLSKGRVNAYNALKGIVPPSLPEPDPSAWREVPLAIESSHPYAESSRLTFPVVLHGAKFIKLHFTKIDLERSYDFVTFETTKGEVIEELTGKRDDYWTDWIAADEAVLRLTSDDSNGGFGFAIDRAAVIE